MENYFAIALLLLPALCGGQGPSYGELAEQLTYPQYAKALALLPTLTNTSQPGDPTVHTLRKGLIKIRNYVDVFVYAFPNATANVTRDAADQASSASLKHKPVDVWKELRGDLNVGYTVVGDFQDLNASKVNYTQKEYEKRLNKCLEWRDSFLADDAKYNYSDYVQNPATDQLFYRPDHDLSPYYWAYAGTEPSLFISGIGNIAALEQGLLNLTLDNYTRVYDLSRVYTKKNQTIFHDYRKLLRSVTTVFQLFDVVQQSNCTSDAEAVLSQAYTLFGNLHDMITAYDFYHQHGNQTECALLAAEIDEGWASLQQFMTQKQLTQQVKCLLASLIPISKW